MTSEKSENFKNAAFRPHCHLQKYQVINHEYCKLLIDSTKMEELEEIEEVLLIRCGL